MKSKTTLLVATILLTIAPSTAAGQQANSTKSKTPQLATDDLKGSAGTGLKPLPAPSSIAHDSRSWQRYSPEELALSIELPGKPMLFAISLLNEPGLNLNPVKAYGYQDREISVFVFRFVSRKSRMTVADLRNFGAGFLNGSAKKPGVSDVETATRVGDDSTVLLESTFKEGSVVFQTRGFVYSKGSDLWLIATRFAQAEEGANELSLRIIDSVKID